MKLDIDTVHRAKIYGVDSEENGARIIGHFQPRSDLGLEMVITDEGIIIDVVNMEGDVIGSWHDIWDDLLENYLSWDGTEGDLF